MGDGGEGIETLDEGWLRAKAGIKWASTPPDELAAWVADMDFPPPPAVAAAMIAEVEAGDLGYPDLRDGSRLAGPFAAWMSSRHGLDLEPGRVREFNDVLNALQAILSLCLRPGDGIAFHAPTYPPFLATFERMGLRPEPIPLVEEGGVWRFDPDRAEEAIGRAEALLIVNPHNPTGRVLTAPELDTLIEAARRSGCVVLSDEVHADLVYDGHSHVATASLDPEVITLFSATKAFNLAGIRCAVAHVGSHPVWEELTARPEHLFGAVANLSVTATRAAWEQGGGWLERVRAVLERNRAAVAERLTEPIRLAPPQGTYLAWLDFSATALAEQPAARLRGHGVRLMEGTDFGPAGAGFARLNFATSPAILSQILDRITTAVEAV